MRRFGEGGRRGRCGEILSNRGKLPLQEKEELVEFLKRNIDVFAWDSCDAPGIDPSLYLPPLQRQPLHYPQKAVTLTPI